MALDTPSSGSGSAPSSVPATSVDPEALRMEIRDLAKAISSASSAASESLSRDLLEKSIQLRAITRRSTTTIDAVLVKP